MYCQTFSKLPKLYHCLRRGIKYPANYLPISLLSSLSKVFEKVLHNRMIRFTEKNDLICPMQYGFRNNMSCVDAIAAITEFVRTEIDKKAQGQACFIDLQKAFDTLDHHILLKKLEDYGFRGKIFEILRDYLSDRWQYISHNGVCTEKPKIVSGVPRVPSWVHFCFFCILMTFICVSEIVPWPCLQMIQQFYIQSAKVCVQFNQIWTIYRSGFVKIDSVYIEINAKQLHSDAVIPVKF